MDVQEALRKAQERALRAKAKVNGSDESGPKITYELDFKLYIIHPGTSKTLFMDLQLLIQN